MTADRVAEKGIEELPGSLGAAIHAMEQDEVIAEALGDHVYNHYLEAKREEWLEYKTQVTEWERDRYLEAY
jgi:glutamine synthetase